MIFQGVLEAFKAVSPRKNSDESGLSAAWWMCLGVQKQKHEPSLKKGWAGGLECHLWSLLYQSEQTLLCCHFAHPSNGNRHGQMLLFSQSSLLLVSVTTYSPGFPSVLLVLPSFLSCSSSPWSQLLKCLRPLSVWVPLSFCFPIFSLLVISSITLAFPLIKLKPTLMTTRCMGISGPPASASYCLLNIFPWIPCSCLLFISSKIQFFSFLSTSSCLSPHLISPSKQREDHCLPHCINQKSRAHP